MQLEKEVYEKFVKTSILFALTLGATLGALLLSSSFFGAPQLGWNFVQVHAHVQLFGWVGLFMMGIAYHIVPRFKSAKLYSNRLANASYWLMLSGVLLRSASQPLAGNPAIGIIVVLSSLLEAAAVAVFVYVIVKTMKSSEQVVESFDRFLVAGATWFLAQSLIGIAVAFYIASNRLVLVPEFINAPYEHLQIFGFAVSMMMGVGIRTLPVFLGLKKVDDSKMLRVLYAYNLAVALRAASEFGSAFYPSLALIALLAELAEFGAIAAFVYSLNLFAKPEVELPAMELSKTYERFVKTAYLWLIAWIALGVLDEIAALAAGMFARGALLHMVTIGFITMMMFGYAQRIIPVFKGVDLHSVRLADAAYVLINAGSVLRVISALLLPFISAAGALLGISGFITLAAFAVFGYNVWATIDKPYEEE